MIHINNTNLPVFIRTWAVPPHKVTENHLKLMISKDIKARCFPDSVHSFSTASGQFHYASAKNRVEIETTCKDQEVVLQLIYGNDLVLLMEETVLPNSMSQCVLSEIKF